ncbi:MAG: alkene reductase [Elusimicrobia bacterium]|nr:alkene reductase [Candidatus Liberimonas magnetica]
MDIFSKFVLGDIELLNRMAMAPMTRSRAVEGDVPNPLAEVYYAERASAGLIISEGSQVSPQGKGYIRTPGIYSKEQVAGWKKVTEAVHREGGRIFLQLWHVGRVSHPDFHNGELPVAPSALDVDGEILTPLGRKKLGVPRALETDEIPAIIEQFKKGAENAKEAGFDGVEIHGANGYLLDEFLRDGSNTRTDKYGGNLMNRARLPLEVAEAVAGVWGAGRVGYRVSPHNILRSMSDSNPARTFTYLSKELNSLGIGYIHLIESLGGRTPRVPDERRIAPKIRKVFTGALILNGGYSLETANVAIKKEACDMVSFGQLFLANPDLPFRFKNKLDLNTPDPETYYTGEEKGYTDYPLSMENILNKVYRRDQTLVR